LAGVVHYFYNIPECYKVCSGKALALFQVWYVGLQDEEEKKLSEFQPPATT
jgi:hypothetical protein